VATTKPRTYNAGDTAAGISAPCEYPWNTPKNPAAASAVHAGTRPAPATAAPRTITEIATPSSVAGSGPLVAPRIPPAIIIATKALGTVQMARPPICALTTPTAYIASR
jgi:hypothetical protein